MQNTNIVASYDYYTLEQAREIIREEDRQKAIRKAECKARRKAERIYYIKQKLMGLAAVCVAIACPLLLDGDATASLFMLPLGLYALFTKEKICNF